LLFFQLSSKSYNLKKKWRQNAENLDVFKKVFEKARLALTKCTKIKYYKSKKVALVQHFYKYTAFSVVLGV
jgi:hypothetical protein